MKGQATLEYMMMFLALIAFTSILVSGMVVALKSANAQANALEHTIRMEELARTLEARSNTGMIMVMSIGNASYRIEGDDVKADYGNRTLVVEGILANGTKRIEPI